MNSNFQGKNNSTLFKFLVATTAAFLVVVAFLFWQQRNVPVPKVVETYSIAHFSDRGKASSITNNYLYQAKHIHDIEAYPSIKKLFFDIEFPQLSDRDKIAEALAEVKEENRSQTEFGKLHVYSTSYYIGNLLILPDLTLHALLVDGTKPNTSILLETALADIRSGVVKIQNHFDVAPPYYYDENLKGATYFPTPSFPSLTVTEAAIVLYVLADLDAQNARLYEQSLHQYANQVFASGGNFYLDIEYGLYLASAYFDIIKQSPDYKELLVLARQEWIGVNKYSLTNYTDIRFPISNFPYKSSFLINPSIINKYQSVNVNEKLSGDLMLSLVDNRLPEPGAKLYHYSLVNNLLLPFAVDLSTKRAGRLGGVTASYAGNKADQYFFLSGSLPKVSESANNIFSESQIQYREGDKVTVLNTDSNYIQKNLRVNSSQDRLLYNQFKSNQKSNPDNWEIRLDKVIQGNLLDSEIITRGTKPVFASDDNKILFLRDGALWHVDLVSKSEGRLFSNDGENESQIEGDLDYSHEAKVLVTSKSKLDLEVLLPQTDISIYNVKWSNENSPELTIVYRIELNDAVVHSVKLSAGGNYLAILVSETLAKRKPRLLIFDINSGIIKKELDLESYSNKAMTIDEWVSFE